MTPPAEGERARAREIVEEWSGGPVREAMDGSAPRGTMGDLVHRLAAALRAPQPRGLTGEALIDKWFKSEYADKHIGYYDTCNRCHDDGGGVRRWPEHASDCEVPEIASALRALNLSAIEGAPAAGEREAVLLGIVRDCLEHDCLTVACGQDHHARARKIIAELDSAPASPRSAAPEDQ